VPGTSSSGGRNRKSTRAHALAGTGRKDRGTANTPTSADDVPDPPKGRPPIPIGLVGPALEEWTRMVLRLEAAKTLSTVDDAALYQYCCLFAETEAIGVALRTTLTLVDTLQAAIVKWTSLVDLLEAAEDKNRLSKDARVQSVIDRGTYGNQIVEAIGQIVQLKKLEAKYVTQLRQGHMAIRQFLVELGMTPAARARVKEMPGAPAADPFSEFDPPKGAKH
jgi:phage terminase small subunit